MSKPRITIVGCGTVGTALGIAIRSVAGDVEIIGHDKDSAAARRAEKLKAIDRSNWNLPAACEKAQLIILAIPQDGIEPTLRAIAPDLIEGAIVTDTSILKAPILDKAAHAAPAHVAYISSDIVFAPERAVSLSNLNTLTPDVFKGAIWTLTPRAGTPSRDIDTLAGLAQSLGATPIFMDAVEHDGLRLSVETLPYALSSALMLAVSDDGAWRERKWMAGSAFERMTAQIDMMQDGELVNTLLAQPGSTEHWLNTLIERIIALRDAVRAGDAETIKAMLAEAHERRLQWLTDWHRGRNETAPPMPIEKPSLLSSLIGARLASRLQNPRPGGDQPGSKGKGKS
ncbi:MAG: prephenate dehydrogenase [Anaerolineae bacterium]|nr:prephenate dehydrogenase [Thermoflexales bacterium]MDW8406986.1 prephenate dehydrogenase [Anaerolineae bacterium]